MAAEATHLQSSDSHRIVAGGALSAGEVVQLADARAAFVAGLQAIASGDPCNQTQRGLAKVASASGTTFSKGDPVYWDASANLAVAPALTLDGSADFYVGTAHKAKVSGETVVEVDLNAQPLLPAIPQPTVFEFDCEDGADETGGTKNIHVLIPANANKRGLLILGAYALVTEVFGGATEDQGIVTITDGSGNTICTLTATDAGADAANDVIVGTSDLFSATTGDAAKVVAAGVTVRGQVTQETSGAGKAGKMKVYVLATPLL